jgi:NADH-quinone oxidoreductase subunit A
MGKILLTPVAAFMIIYITMTLFSNLLGKLSFKKGKRAEGTEKSYACGEDAQTNLMQPDYSQFFPFAFFFSILHVVALMIATVPVKTMGTVYIALIYILGAMVGLAILFRR